MRISGSLDNFEFDRRCVPLGWRGVDIVYQSCLKVIVAAHIGRLCLPRASQPAGRARDTSSVNCSY